MRKFLRSPLVILAIICFIIAALIPFVFTNQSTAIKGVSQKSSTTATITSTPLRPTGFEEQLPTQATTPNSISTATPKPSQNPLHPSDSAGQAPTSTANNSEQTVQVSLAINNSSVGTVTVGKDANQCDVLTAAKDQGKISSLLMKYDNSLGTNGVYQINGVGKENAIWWVYKVNGKSATQGCSYMKVNSGDSVAWEYIGQ